MNTLTVKDLHDLFDQHPEYSALEFPGPCHDCAAPVAVAVALSDDGFAIAGGAVYRYPFDKSKYAVKCDACHAKQPVLAPEIEVYDRVVGYFRPVKNFNDGQRAQQAARKRFDRGLKPMAEGCSSC